MGLASAGRPQAPRNGCIWDGHGYPDGLAGTEIPLGSRIISVCDSYDAMTSDRSYRRAMSEEVARAELSAGAGSQFDPEVVAAFLRIQEQDELMAAKKPVDRTWH